MAKEAKVTKKVEDQRYTVRVGDKVDIQFKIREGDKSRLQSYKGLVIAQNGHKEARKITVRKISHGVGVEKIVSLQSPLVESIGIITEGNVRRSKLYYMRERVGKKAMKVKISGKLTEKDKSSKLKSSDSDV